jgi:TolB-like protein/tetratricopeptide (TPR) repeat protein
MDEGRLPDGVYEFGDFRLLAAQRRLTARSDGRQIELTQKAFEALLYLVQRPGEPLDKAALMAAVWPSVVVEENNLNQVISALRRALGDGGTGKRFILTIPGRGYQFVAPVLRVPNETAAAPAAKPAAATRKSVAVLPFVNLTGDPAKEYFGDGMAEELIHILARIPGLKVPSRTSSFSYKGRNVDVREIARDLDVTVVLEGSVRSAGERIRVTAQLIDGATGFHVWSENYDRRFGDLFELQDELARAIMATLRLSLEGGTAAQVRPEPPTRDVEAYHLYLRAMAVQGGPGVMQGLPASMRMLEQALGRDPGFARAHSAVASLRAIALVLDVPLPGTLADTERDVLRNLASDATLGPTHAALGIIYAAQGKWLLAQQQFRDAIARDDGDPGVYQAYGLHFLGSTGLLRRSLDATLKAHRLAPGWVVTYITLAVAYTLVDEREAAEQYVLLSTDLGLRPTTAPLCDVRSQLALRAGRFDEARDIIVAGLPPEMGDSAGIEAARKLVAAFQSGTGAVAATQALDAVRARLEAEAWSQAMKRRFMIWYTQLGALDQSFEVANESLDHFGHSGSIGTAWGFLWLQEMLPFRRDARFQAMCRRMGLIDFWERNGPPDHCELSAGVLVCR